MRNDLLRLAAAIARGEYHPSHCVEDYRKGTGRAEFAEMAGDCADQLRGKLYILKDAAARIAELEAEVERLRNTLAVKEKMQRITEEECVELQVDAERLLRLLEDMVEQAESSMDSETETTDRARAALTETTETETKEENR